MKLKKRILAAILAAGMAYSLAGCGMDSSSTSSSSAESSASSESAEVSQSSDESSSSSAEQETTEEGRYHKLTKDDIMAVYSPVGKEVYQDMSMDEGIPSSDAAELTLTEEEKEQIRSMGLRIAIEKDALDDAGKWQVAGMQEVAEDLGIEVADIWVAADKTGNSQTDDYVRFEAIADQYDAFFTLPVDLASSSEILMQIMEKTKVGFICSAPFGVDWDHENFIGVSDADNYLAGVYSAQASVDILGGKGKIGVIGWENGHSGSFHTCWQRYQGWEDVFAENPDIETVEAWYDQPANAKQVVSGLLASNPDIELLLIDFANPPADEAQALLKEMGYTAWDDISVVTIDTDATIAIPMASDGPDNNYVAAFAGQDWYGAGKNIMLMYAKHLLDSENAPKFVAAPPTPVSVYENLKTNYEILAPEGWDIPQEVMALENQWTYDE